MKHHSCRQFRDDQGRFSRRSGDGTLAAGGDAPVPSEVRRAAEPDASCDDKPRAPGTASGDDTLAAGGDAPVPSSQSGPQQAGEADPSDSDSELTPLSGDHPYYCGDLKCKKLGPEWRDFVADNRLRIGDACVFEVITPAAGEPGNEVVFKVQVLRGDLPSK